MAARALGGEVGVIMNLPVGFAGVLDSAFGMKFRRPLPKHEAQRATDAKSHRDRNKSLEAEFLEMAIYKPRKFTSIHTRLLCRRHS